MKTATKIYKNHAAFMKDYDLGLIPANLVSPGGAASQIGITRQSVEQRMVSGSLESWRTKDGYVYISMRSIREVMLKKQGIPDTQGEMHEFAT